MQNSYIVKLLTLFVKRNNGSIRVPASDLMSVDIGQGIRVWWDDQSKELVIDFMPSGATIYKIEGNQTWLTNQLLPNPDSLRKPPAPLSQEDLIAKAWTDSAATPSNQELASQRRSRVLHVEDEDMALREAEITRNRIMRELEATQPPAPSTRPVTPSGNRTTFYKQ